MQRKVKVLDDGYVRLVKVLGDDKFIVKVARNTISTLNRKLSQDRALLRYLMRHRHTTPFEFAEMVFQVRVPMDCWRQWIRHRTASVNEYSTRYSKAIDSMAKAEEWRLQATSNRQGSCGLLGESESKTLTTTETAFHKAAKHVYQQRLNFGVAREQARKDLPLSNYTEAMWKIDLHNLLHFLSLRLDPHAQWEIRQYAKAIAEFVEDRFPVTWEAFLDFRLKAKTLSGPDIKVIQDCFAPFSRSEIEEQRPGIFEGREGSERAQKFIDIGIMVP